MRHTRPAWVSVCQGSALWRRELLAICFLSRAFRHQNSRTSLPNDSSCESRVFSSRDSSQPLLPNNVTFPRVMNDDRSRWRCIPGMLHSSRIVCPVGIHVVPGVHGLCRAARAPRLSSETRPWDPQRRIEPFVPHVAVTAPCAAENCVSQIALVCLGTHREWRCTDWLSLATKLGVVKLRALEHRAWRSQRPLDDKGLAGSQGSASESYFAGMEIR